MPRKKKEELGSVGQRIKKVRLEKKIGFAQIANQTGFTTNYLKEIESGQIIPPVGTLLRIAKALEIDSGFFLKDMNRVKQFTKRTDNYAYTTLTPGAENKHLKAFKIGIEPHQEHLGVGYCHEGEEFVYVLKGKIEITVGEHVNTLGVDDTLHFNSGIKHKLCNISQEDAELLVVIYNP